MPGRRQTGVASIYGLHVSGTLAWALWRAIYQARVPSARKRLPVALDWTLDALFGREVAAVPGMKAQGRVPAKEGTGGKD